MGMQVIDKNPPIRSRGLRGRAQEYKIQGVAKASRGGVSPSYLGESYMSLLNKICINSGVIKKHSGGVFDG